MDSGSLSFVALVTGALARWRTAAAVAAGTVVLVALLAVILPPSYRATASFVTTESELRLSPGGGAGGGGGGLGGLAAAPEISGIASQLGLGSTRDPSESPAFYAQLLASRELLTRLLTSRFPDPRAAAADDSVTLLSTLRIHDDDPQRALETAVKRLRRKMRTTFDLKTNLVTLTLDARWSPLAADAANRAVALVSAFNKEQRVSRARARRDFLATRVTAAQAELRAVEDSQKLFYERNRSWQDSPSLLVEERRLRRQVETANSLYLSLRHQYEAARIDEVNNTPVITVVDQAVPPRRPEWPRFGLMLAAAVVLGVGLGSLAAAARELAARWARDNPEQAALLRAAFSRATREIAGVLPGRHRNAHARAARAA
jgi:uncharacterized protein involved in exopolysaccharide biosynthesis